METSDPGHGQCLPRSAGKAEGLQGLEGRCCRHCLFTAPSRQQGQSPSDSLLYLSVSLAHAHLQRGDFSRSSPGQLVVVTSQGDADTEVRPPTARIQGATQRNAERRSITWARSLQIPKSAAGTGWGSQTHLPLGSLRKHEHSRLP